VSLRVAPVNTLIFLSDMSRRVAAGRVSTLTQRIEIVELRDAMEDGTAKREPFLAFAGSDLLAGEMPLATRALERPLRDGRPCARKISRASLREM
jgi:hypothetical protein